MVVRFTRDEITITIRYLLRRLQFLPEISGVTVSLLVVVDSGVEGWPMASLHHLVADLPALQTWEEGEAADQHQMYTDMQTVTVTIIEIKIIWVGI